MENNTFTDQGVIFLGSRPSIFKPKIHDAISFFYETEQEWYEVVIPYLIAGLKNNEKCIYVLTNHTPEHIRASLQAEGVNSEVLEARGQLSIIHPRDFVDQKEAIGLEQIVDLCKQMVEQSLEEGYACVRISCESFLSAFPWLGEEQSIALGKKIYQELISTMPCISLCQYHRYNTSNRMLVYAMYTHPKVLYNRELYPTHVNLHGGELISEQEGVHWEADYWLEHLRRNKENSRRLHFYMDLLEHSTQPLLVLAPDGSIVAVNQALCQLTGYSRQELLGMRVYYRDLMAEMIEKVRDSAQAQYFEYSVLARNGEVLYLQFIIHAILDNIGRPEYYYAMVNDAIRQKEDYRVLRMSEKKYKMILQTAYDIILVLDTRDNRIRFFNPALTKILGYDEQDLENMNALDLIHIEDRQHIHDVLREGIYRGEGQGVYRCITKDGNYVWLEANGRILGESQEKGRYFVLLVCRDITERKQAVEALQASENRLRQIMGTIQDVVIYLDRYGKIGYISPSYRDVLGYDFSGLIESNLELFHTEDREKIMAYIHEVMAGKHPGNMEYRIQHAQGDYLWVEVIGNPVFNEQGRVIGGVFANRDISAHKQTEVHLWKSKQTLRKQLEFLQTLLDSMDELFFTYNQNYIITFINKKVENILGMPSEDIIGSSLFEFISLEDWMDKHRLENGHEERFIKTALPNNRQILLRLKVSPITENGTIAGGMVLAEDVSEFVRIKQEMDRLSQLQTIGEMAASIGHEIRNPITTVHGFLQILSQNEDIENYKPYFLLMLEELDRVNMIVAEFLSLAKNREIRLEKENLRKLVKILSPFILADAIKLDLTVDFDLKKVPEILIDEKEIRQMIFNLVRNAMEATPAGGKIIISTYVSDKVYLSIQDQGKGIPQEIQDKLGTPFLTTKEQGTGLGLAVCYSIADRNGARISFHSCSQGTTFLVAFPISDT